MISWDFIFSKLKGNLAMIFAGYAALGMCFSSYNLYQLQLICCETEIQQRKVKKLFQ